MINVKCAYAKCPKKEICYRYVVAETKDQCYRCFPCDKNNNYEFFISIEEGVNGNKDK